jgi:hypothetical protein
MGFVPKRFDLAHDPQKEITIKWIYRFEDTGPDYPLSYSYSQGDLVFEFRASEYREWRMMTSYNGSRIDPAHTATYIIEKSIGYGLERAKCPRLASGEYQDLKRNIKKGMWALETRGGGHLRFVPDFRLEFVGDMKDVPKMPPRPSDLDVANSVVAASDRPRMSEPGDSSGFVYEENGAHNSDKDITIIRVHKFEDIGPDDPTPYICSQGDLVFEFRASRYREWRMEPSKDGPKLMSPHMATFVIEDSIKQGLVRANCRSLAPDEYQELKQNIKDGMWATEVSAYSLRSVPEFRIEFVDRAEEAPTRPPRPSSWDTVRPG